MTPGVVATKDSKVVCAAGYTVDARHVTRATKRAVFKRYGFIDGKYRPGDYEIDHFISLELGGANHVDNLWPQPFQGARTARMKDVVETNLHRRVCRGETSLEEAQRIISTDWVAEYQRIKANH